MAGKFLVNITLRDPLPDLVPEYRQLTFVDYLRHGAASWEGDRRVPPAIENVDVQKDLLGRVIAGLRRAGYQVARLQVASVASEAAWVEPDGD